MEETIRLSALARGLPARVANTHGQRVVTGIEPYRLEL